MVQRAVDVLKCLWGFESIWGMPHVLPVCMKPYWHLVPKLPCVKLKAPTPSIVPAAKLYPKAGLHVLTLIRREEKMKKRYFKTSSPQHATSCCKNITFLPSLCLHPASSCSYRVRGIELHRDITHVHPLVSWAEGSCDLLVSFFIQFLRDTQGGNPWGKRNQEPSSSEIQLYEPFLHSVDTFQWPLPGVKARVYFPSSFVPITPSLHPARPKSCKFSLCQVT